MRQSHINFRNRVDELDLFMQQSNRVSIGKPRILMFSATDSFGATAFLQEAYHSSLSVSFNVFLDCSERSLDGFLRETIFSLENQEPELAELLQAGLHKLDAPSTEKKLCSAALVAFPYIGRSIKELSTSHKNSIAASYRMQTSPNAILEELAKYLHGKKVTVFLDNYQDLDSVQQSYLNDLFFYLNEAQILLVACEKAGESNSKNLIKLREAGFEVVSKELEPLSLNVLKEIAKDRGVLLDDSELRPFEKSNLYDVLEYIYDSGSNVQDDEILRKLSPVGRYLISAITICEQPITKKFLTAVAKESAVVSIISDQVLMNEITQLIADELIIESKVLGELGLRINVSFRTKLKRELPQAEILVHSDEIYKNLIKSLKSEFASSRITDYLFAFNLSLIVDSQRSAYWAHQVLSLSLQHRSKYDVLDFVKNNLRPETNYTVFLLCLAAAMQRKDFHFFKNIYESVDYQFQIQVEAMIFKAIYLSRCRDYSSSSDLFNAVNLTGRKDQFETLILSYKIINEFHQGNFKKAKETFYSYLNYRSDSALDSYIMRIGAGLLPRDQGIEVLKNIIASFTENKDEFGTITTKANLGAFYCKSGNYKEGLIELSEAYDRLQAYGHENITHCALSLSAAFIDTGRASEAREILNGLIRFPEDNHYSLVAQSLLAQIEILEGKKECGVKCFGKLFPQVLKTPTYNLKSVFFINYALAKAVEGQYDVEYQSCLENAQNHPPKRQSEKWNETLTKLKSIYTDGEFLSVNEFQKMSFRGYFEYWWFDPGSILINGGKLNAELTNEASSNHMLN